MSRVEKFRKIRRTKIKYIMVLVWCIFMLASGACIVDFSTNSLIKNERAVKLVTLKNEETHTVLSILNRKFYFNTSFLRKDINRLKESILKE